MIYYRNNNYKMIIIKNKWKQKKKIRMKIKRKTN